MYTFYFDRVINLSPPASPTASLQDLESNLAQINEADLARRTFTVMIIEIPQERDSQSTVEFSDESEEAEH